VPIGLTFNARDRGAVDFDHDHCTVIGSHTEPMIIERQDAGRTGLNHLYFDAQSQTDFFQPHDEIVLAVDLLDTACFAGPKEFKWDEFVQGKKSGGCGGSVRKRQRV
jgi:hypothetical protein